jgi:hypothetical protein
MEPILHLHITLHERVAIGMRCEGTEWRGVALGRRNYAGRSAKNWDRLDVFTPFPFHGWCPNTPCRTPKWWLAIIYVDEERVMSMYVFLASFVATDSALEEALFSCTFYTSFFSILHLQLLRWCDRKIKIIKHTFNPKNEKIQLIFSYCVLSYPL